MPFVTKRSEINDTAREITGEKIDKLNSGRGERLIPVRARWGELDSNVRWQKASHLGWAAAIITGAALLINPNGPALLGVPSREIPKDQLIEQATASIYKNMQSMTVAEKYTTQYITDKDQREYLKQGGTSVVGVITNMPSTTVSVIYGSDCLSGSGYDITPSTVRGRGANGDIAAAASLQANQDGTVQVYPAGSNGAPLTFRLNESSSQLLPDENTARTLGAYGCYQQGLELQYIVHDGNDTQHPIN